MKENPQALANRECYGGGAHSNNKNFNESAEFKEFDERNAPAEDESDKRTEPAGVGNLSVGKRPCPPPKRSVIPGGRLGAARRLRPDSTQYQACGSCPNLPDVARVLHLEIIRRALIVSLARSTSASMSPRRP